MTGSTPGGADQPQRPPDANPHGSGQTAGQGVPSFAVVGIGASAGGLTAIEAFFSSLPSEGDTGISFVVVQHLAPDHKSILAEIIRRYTPITVFEVEDGMTVRPNCIYIIPPNRDMALLNGTLQLLEPGAPRGHRMPIDFFFRSLAHDQHERAICIVLSGTGSDGTLGVRAVKGEGGIVMVQNPASTEYNGMPQAAIATGLVDYVLSPAEMPAQLIAYVAHAFGGRRRLLPTPPPLVEDALKKIFVLLRAQTSHDFSQYKQTTITRRVERRMAVHQIERLDEYLRYLRQTPVEVDALFRDLLIGVTSFFRDPAAFAALEEKVIPRLFEAKPPGAAIRVWVPACSTGEEAYSIAILLQEQVEITRQSFKVQVFATDIDAKAIQQARSGVYPASIASDISPERLARFFTAELSGSSYRIHKGIRDLLVLSEQDVIRDPPFSKLDLVSCRNFLIYVEGELQKKLIPLFHYALAPGGFLFLGTSESVGESVDLFATLDRQWRLYERKKVAPPSIPPPGRPFLPIVTEAVAGKPQRTIPGQQGGRLRELTEQALLEQYAAVAMLVDTRGDILYLHGRTGRYLEPAPGAVGVNVLQMAREGLRRELTTALRKCAACKEAVREDGLRVKTNGSFVSATLTVKPVAVGPDRLADLFLVVLEEAPPVVRDESPMPSVPQASKTEHESFDQRIVALSQELRAKEEYLQATNEELETANEELKSSNEEMQSVNEELQSTNEELETSKEELQSVNEELTTLNGELQQKVADLSRANNDMSNLLAGTGIGTIFVDFQLRVQRFTPAVTALINLIPTDVGRPLSHIMSNLIGYDNLWQDVHSVLEKLVPREVEVHTKAGAWYSLRIRPYRTLDNVIEGAVITFVDITEIREAREARRESEALGRLAVVVRDSRDAIVAHDMEGRIVAWNPGAERMYGWSEAEALTMNMRELMPANLQQKEAAKWSHLGAAGALEPYRTQRLDKDGRTVDVWLTAAALVNTDGKAYGIATTEQIASSK
jgi:two-component system, chemotaxis family, CheB/CheR fusion protein